MDKQNINFINDDVDDDVEQDLNIDIQKFSQAVIWGTDWTTETINMQMTKGNIDLSPSFQRRDAWDEKEKSRLIESLMLGLPVPPIILAENRKKRNSYIVIDGKQRLLSIRQFYADKININNKNNTSIDKFEVLKLSGLSILKDYNKYTYCSKETDNDFEQFVAALDNQPIRTVVIKNWPDEEFLYTVFLRLNTGSKKLSSQELRQALKPGPFLKFLDDKTADSKPIQAMLHNKSADKRMVDIELALRFFAFKYFITSYSGNFKKFLDMACDRLNSAWKQHEQNLRNDFNLLEKAINFAFKIIDEDNPFARDKSHPRFNRSLFELFTYYFSYDQIRELVEINKDEFIKEFKNLNSDSGFVATISSATKDTSKVIKRFELFAKLLKRLPGAQQVSIPYFIIDGEKHIQISHM